jgi:hypothetical protein
MSLENLLRIGQLKQYAATREEIARVLASAEAGIADANNRGNTPTTRFTCAYRSIMQCALVGLHAHGYRPDTKRLGHHATIVQSLALTLNVDGVRVHALDKLREKRNLSDYTGAELDEAATEACIAHARRLLQETRDWLRANRPNLS